MSDAKPFVELDNVAIRFLEHDPFRTLKHRLLRRNAAAHPAKSVLEGVSFRAEAGERIGIIGANGSGKTTLLKAIAGILPPVSGRRIVRGSIAPVIAQGLGFNGLLSVRDNIKLGLLYAGHLSALTAELERKILDFAELTPRANELVANLSSGQQARLAFAVSLFQEPKILLLDEVFATGDAAFQRKASAAMESWIDRTPIVFLASHDDELIRRLCRRCILIEDGRITADGNAEQVTSAYMWSVTGSA